MNRGKVNKTDGVAFNSMFKSSILNASRKQNIGTRNILNNVIEHCECIIIANIGYFKKISEIKAKRKIA